jgi:hypothetical protein
MFEKHCFVCFFCKLYSLGAEQYFQFPQNSKAEHLKDKAQSEQRKQSLHIY